MKIRLWILIALLVSLAGCNQAASLVPTATKNIKSPPAALSTVNAPDVKVTARAYLDAWKANDYTAMYQMLSSVSQDAISQENFIKHYRGVAAEAALTGLDYDILSSLTRPDTGQVSYRVILHSFLVGDVQGNTLMNLKLENGQWKVEWDDTLVLPQLAGGNYLFLERYIPARANIYDRNGHALVAQVDATAIGLNPDKVDPAQIDTLFTELSSLTGMRVDTLKAMYDAYPKGKGWYMPIAEVSADKVNSRFAELSGLSGLVLTPYKSRVYFDGGIAPHVVGYVGVITDQQVDEYARRGYRQDERVGQSGLEKWGEPYLAGKRGGALYVYNAQNQPVTKLAETSPQPSQAIYTTIDRDFQQAVQDALGGFRGAIVVLERDTGRVLAMASSPAFDPNAFEPVNFNSTTLLNELNSQDQPMLNRATQGQYPLGSVFKTVTMAAAIESGRFTPDTTYQCGYFFNEIPGATLNDWTYDFFQRDHVTQPSGLLTLSGGLIRSCNPFFWHIGLDLYKEGLTKAIADMARGFGLGSPTGIQGMDEASGQVPEPQNEVDAVNLAIGQGNFLTTPLQVADFMAAVGNGGTLYRPQVVEKIAPPDGNPTFVFKPEVRGKLPIQPETLQAIQEALRGVIVSTKPRGTAVEVFSGLDIKVAGKTGTATSGTGLPHAWFAGYTFEERKDKPDIAIAVVLENAGEGSAYAAPIFRRIVEKYFNDSLGPLLPWESSYYVTRTPAPDSLVTPTPPPGATLAP
jgi:penicillin-binding protein 2